MSLALQPMAAFDAHSQCACCHDKGKGNDTCMMHQACSHCNILTSDQQAQLATPSYKLKKEKRYSKSDKTDGDNSSTQIDPTLVSVLGAGNEKEKQKSPDKGVAKERNKHYPCQVFPPDTQP